MIEIKSYPAKNGDAFLIKVSDIRFSMLIDGGYSETFYDYIKPDLEFLAADGYALDVVVATHIDADHISGLLSFFGQNGSAQSPTIIPVHEVLHNSLRSLVALTGEKVGMRKNDLALLKDIRFRGFPKPPSVSGDGDEISVRQGNSLSQLLSNGNYRWNTNNGRIAIGNGGLDKLHLPQATITFLSPNEARRDSLRKWWVSEIRRTGFAGSLDNLDDIFEYICAYEMEAPGAQMLSLSDADLATSYIPDNSITNGSSISFMVEVEGQRLLFLGDSWAGDIVAALTPYGSSIYDAVKVAHHGSARNTNWDLLALVDSPHFFISTNGDAHGHPDFAVLKAIVDRPGKSCRTLHFNYSTPQSRRLKTYKSKSNVDFVVADKQTEWVTVPPMLYD